MSKLFQPLQIGNVQLKHRIAMAPLTRFRGSQDNVQLPIAETYYEQRASVPGTLIISEATFISPRATGFANIPGIWNREQIEAWKSVTEKVHAKGSYIFLQLWAHGRKANKVVAASYGFDVVSASTIPMNASSATPRPLTIPEIKLFVEDYAQAARNAIEAGFDGVEIHAANGYLIDQFTQDVSNDRTDIYGGSIENRSRFGLEVAKAVVDAIGPERVGIRFSPWSKTEGMGMADPIPQFTNIIAGLKPLGLAYLHMAEPWGMGPSGEKAAARSDFAIQLWQNQSPIIIGGGYLTESAKKLVDVEYPDKEIVVSFGRNFISNPDLPLRMEHDIPLNPYDPSAFSTPMAAKGYSDYPFSEEFQRSV